MAKLFWVAVWTAGVVWVTIALVDGEKYRPVIIQAECLDGGQYPRETGQPQVPDGVTFPWPPLPSARPDDPPLVPLQATED